MLRPTVLLVTAAALLTGCGAGPGPTAAGGRLQVVATTTQVADFARVVGGDRIRLTPLLRPNVDPHDYEASPADVAAIAGADVLVRNGVGLESFLDRAVSSAGFAGTVVDASRGIAIRPGNGEPEERDGDPHIWHDPRNATLMVRTIAAAFAAADPAGAAAYRAAATAYATRLQTLDADIARQVATVPPARRTLVTNHDAFGYYVARYGLRFVGSIVPSFDTSAELSGKDIRGLVARIRATGATAVFSESSLPPKTAETVGREAGVRVVGGADALYGDTLGPPGSDGDTYLRMEEHNTRTIVAALRG